METKVCSNCRGTVHVHVQKEDHPDGTHTTYVIGKCGACGKEFTEAEVLALEGPGPVAG